MKQRSLSLVLVTTCILQYGCTLIKSISRSPDFIDEFINNDHILRVTSTIYCMAAVSLLHITNCNVVWRNADYRKKPTNCTTIVSNSQP